MVTKMLFIIATRGRHRNMPAAFRIEVQNGRFDVSGDGHEKLGIVIARASTAVVAAGPTSSILNGLWAFVNAEPSPLTK